MDCGRLIFAVIGFSASFFLCIPNLKRWQRQQISAERLRIVSEALDHAEERVARSQERHDRILSQICTFYLTNQNLEEALVGARRAMEEASEFVSTLRKMQMRIISSFPDEVDVFNHVGFD
ncbi:hypothetical protein CRG98_028070 [Punica granatum]|uniref:Uncharacterized protein n=1 Tax=Punica granatum TaxID=22663 RepID=A0A2I0J6H1_PUNGR|nr:hypothetical protein CRG98_028070 [Punica granatum]